MYVEYVLFFDNIFDNRDLIEMDIMCTKEDINNHSENNLA